MIVKRSQGQSDSTKKDWISVGRKVRSTVNKDKYNFLDDRYRIIYLIIKSSKELKSLLKLKKSLLESIKEIINSEKAHSIQINHIIIKEQEEIKIRKIINISRKKLMHKNQKKYQRLKLKLKLLKLKKKIKNKLNKKRLI